jgi:hypothetical protein
MNNNKKIYWLGLLGLIPNLGIVIGCVLIFLGFKRKDNKLKLIGLSDILFTLIFWFLFIQFTNSSSIVKNANYQMTIHYLDEVVKDLEYFKSKNGFYPDSLGELRKQNKFFIDEEVFGRDEMFKEEKRDKFYYQKTNDDYILKSFGEDRKINTEDDIYPNL